MQSNDINTYIGIYGIPDPPSLQAFQTMMSFSFKALGDGSRYTVRLPTYETREGDHYLYYFQTIKDEIISVKVNVPGDLIRLGWSGKEAEFIQESVMFFQIEIVNPGPFYLKFWDIKLYKYRQ